VPTLGRPGRASSVFDRNSGPEKAFDGDHQTHWKAAQGQLSAWLEVDLGKPARVGYVSLIEGWESESTTRRFRLEYKVGEQWKTIFEGTRIGRAFGRAFEPVTAQVFRLVIGEATGAPQIEEMQLLPEN
jgi:alpha-L-fucosidase